MLTPKRGIRIISHIEIGTRLKCLNCQEKFEVAAISFNPRGEYIECPHCQAIYDVQLYHIFGQEISEVDK